jgi:hypothetical protein
VKELQFKPKFTPEQVKAKLAEKAKANAAPNAPVNTEKPVEPKKTQKAAKTKIEKKAKTEKKEIPVEFPVSGHVNAYGFLFLKGKWLKALDWRLNMPVKIERNADGSVTVRKA